MSEPGLHLSREVRIGEMIGALMAVSAVVTGYIELRLRPIEQQITAVKEASRVQGEAASEFKRDLKADMLRVEAKLDRLIEALPARVVK